MTSAASPAAERADPRTIVGGGIKLGLATAIGVAIFALLSRPLSGRAELIVQAVLVLVGGGVFAYAPAAWIRPRGVDGIAWAALLGLLGSFVFSIIDTAVLRPVHLYHWTWDAIGGGSGFWYIPVWWMGSTVLAWLGSWVYSNGVSGGSSGNVFSLAGQTIALALLLFVLLAATQVAPFSTAIVALSFAIALILHVPLSVFLRSR